jgi:hypothetical protein
MPKRYGNKDAIIIVDDEVQQFSDIIRNAYLLSRVGDSEIAQVRGEFEELKNELLPRMAFMERTLTNLIKPPSELFEIHKKNNDIPLEQKPDKSEPIPATNNNLKV